MGRDDERATFLPHQHTQQDGIQLRFAYVRLKNCFRVCNRRKEFIRIKASRRKSATAMNRS